MKDLVDELVVDWAEERPELDCSGLGVVLRIQFLAKLLTESAERCLEEFGLKLWEYDVMSALRRQGTPYEMLASELARASMLTSGTITTRIDGLEQRGLVERRPDVSDRRAINVRLTRNGLATIHGAISARMAGAETQLQWLSGKERDALSGALRKLLHGMSDHKAAA